MSRELNVKQEPATQKILGEVFQLERNSKYKGLAAVMNLRCTREEKKGQRVTGYSECAGEGGK